MVSKLTKNPEKSRTGMAVTGPTNVATWSEMQVGCEQRSLQGEGYPTHSDDPKEIPVAGKEVCQRAKTRMVAKNSVSW